MFAKKFRQDIQALRGFSIAAVLAYHTTPAELPGGFLGVDVFFVISGYLMAGIICEGIVAGQFNLVGFYLRRARRLLPAAYVTFSACAIAAPFLLSSLEYAEFRKQLAGALSFTSNFVLWRQSGYFAQASELKPLLHTWSLAVEEQYYLLLPAFLMLCPRRFWLASLSCGAVFSFGLGLYVAEINPSGAFYLLPTRAWELLLGSIGVLLIHPGARAIASGLFWPAVLALPFAVVFASPSSPPGFEALIVCLATLAILLARDERASRGPLVATFAWLGDLSYPLYLVHWPIFAFIRNIWIAGAPVHVLALAGATSVAIAWIVVRFVERPVRARLDGLETWRQVAVFSAPAAIMIALSLAANLHNATHYIAGRRANQGLASVCDAVRFSPEPPCRYGDAKAPMLLWGDSFAMHLAQALAESDRGFVQATLSACAPLMDFAIVDPASLHPQTWSKNCIEFNQMTLDYLGRNPAIEVVILSSAFLHALEERGPNRILADGRIRTPSTELAADHLARTIASVRKLGRKVVMMAPVPSGSFDVALCAEREDRRQLTRGATPDCTIDRASSMARQARVRQVLQIVQERTGAPILDLGERLCATSACAARIDGVVLYRDAAHLSAEGSALLGRKFSLSDLVFGEAR